MFNKGTLAATLMVAVMALAAAACGSATADPAEDRSTGSFLGLPVEEAGMRAEEQGRLWRIVKEDGVALAVTADYSEDRLNFTVDDGVVVAAVTDAEMVEDGAAGIQPGEQDRESVSFVGLSVNEAAARAEEQGRPWRIIKEDGVDLAVTADYSEDRLNFTVDDSVVVAAVTDAEMVKDDTEPSSCAGQEPVIDDGEVIGVFDVNDDGRDEIFGVIDDDGELVQIGIWTWDASCSLHRVALDGSPAVLGVGLTESIAEGVSCNPAYVDDLYTIKLTSNDGGSTYEGRITAYSLEGSDLVEASGEGAAFPAEDVAVTAILACGELTYP